MGSRREAVAWRRDGCFICTAWNDEVIALEDHGVIVCRPCVTRVSAAILRANPHLVALLWPKAVLAPEPRSLEIAGGADANLKEVFEQFKTGVQQQIGDNAQAHFDLAVAYDEMGLVADAVREAATALGAKAPLAFKTRVLSWLFARERARPDALAAITTMLREG
jgi:hypothetical protein